MASTAFSIATGQRLWQRPSSMPAAGVSARGTLLLTRYDNEFQPIGAEAVDIRTGTVRWQTTHRWSVQATDYTGGFFLVDDTAGSLLKVNARSGRTAWTKPGLGGPLAVDRDQIYVTSGTDLVSISAGSGGQIWRRGDSASKLRPVVAAGVVYTVSPQHLLETLNAANGHRLGFTSGYQLVDHAVVNGGWLYLTDASQLRSYTVPGGPGPSDGYGRQIRRSAGRR
jgi:outer membrane protein assembly factor BamB